MTSWDTLWWLVLGSLLGWAALWLTDKLLLRDGEVAGLRAERQLASAQAELQEVRSFQAELDGRIDSLTLDARSAADQLESLRAELALVGNERRRLDGELEVARARARELQRELDEARAGAAERERELERLGSSFAALEASSAQARQRSTELERSRTDSATRLAAFEKELAARDERLAQAQRALGRAGNDILLVQRNARLLEARLPQAPADRRSDRLRTSFARSRRRLLGLQRTIDALASADEARRRASVDSESRRK